MLINFLKLHIRQPKFQLGVTLSLIFLSALVYRWSLDPVISLIIALFATIGSDLIFVKLRKKNLFFPSAALVTAFIIALLVDPQLPWYEIALTGIIAMVSKNFLRFSERHVFNPAAFGLLLAAFIFNHNVSWWGVSFQQFSTPNFFSQGLIVLWTTSVIYFLILISPALISCVRMRRFRITLTFLAIYAISNTFISSGVQIPNTLYLLLNTFLDPTVLFFALVMLPEPMTTPSNHTRQMIFGVAVAILTMVTSSQLFSFSPDPLTLALLIGNILFFRFR